MIFATFAFFIVTLAIGITRIVEGQTLQGVAFLVAGLLAYLAGSSFKLGLFAKEPRPRRAAFAIAGLCTLVAAAFTTLTGVTFEAYGQEMHGIAWVMAGLIAGLITTRKPITPAF